MAVVSRLREWLGDCWLLLACGLFALVEWATAGRRDDAVWVFGARGGRGFVDNAKYLYLHLAAERPSVRPVWLSKDRTTVGNLRAKGYPAHYAYSPAGIACSLRAGVVVVTQGLGDVALPLAGGATVINLWHGTPLKTISWDAEFRDRSRSFRAAHAFLARQVDLLTISGESAVESFRSGLRVPPERMATTGYPRLDALFGAIPGEEVGLAESAHEEVVAVAREHTVVCYLPTYRRDAGADVQEHLDLDALFEVLEAHDAVLFVKAHPFEPLDLGGERERIRALPAETDVYPFLRHCDVLLSDYSSTLFDFLALDRPIVFYPFDLDRYRVRRGFYHGYESVAPGPVATDFEGLLDALERTFESDEFADERRVVRERFLANPEPGRSAAVYRAIRERLEDDLDARSIEEQPGADLVRPRNS